MLSHLSHSLMRPIYNKRECRTCMMWFVCVFEYSDMCAFVIYVKDGYQTYQENLYLYLYLLDIYNKFIVDGKWNIHRNNHRSIRKLQNYGSWFNLYVCMFFYFFIFFLYLILQQVWIFCHVQCKIIRSRRVKTHFHNYATCQSICDCSQDNPHVINTHMV